MKNLPAEIVLQIISFLEHQDITRLQLVSRHMLSISRDNNLWRCCCFKNSAAEKARKGRGSVSLEVRSPHTASIHGSHEGGEIQDDTSGPVYNPSVRRRRAMSAWDMSYPEEKVDWYQEYIARHGPLSVSWTQQPVDAGRDGSIQREILGLGLLRTDSDGVGPNGNIIVAPLDDRSICLWDASQSDRKSTGVRKGRVINRSKPGLLAPETLFTTQNSRLPNTNPKNFGADIVECVSVDSLRNRAYFAVDHCLSEIDLATLQVIAQSFYCTSISALSEIHYTDPLTVGTNDSLYIHDSRLKTLQDDHSSSTEKCETVLQSITTDGSISNFDKGVISKQLEHTQLLQPGPVFILHFPVRAEVRSDTDIYVAGRFSSILHYDRRYFPRLRGTLYSGARLASLAALPFPLLSDNRPGRQSRNLEQRGQNPTEKTLIACGEYNGKGSLELYGLSTNVGTSSKSYTGSCPKNVYKNRQTASSSKLLSVVNHGTRLLVSDGDGMLKWMERDGATRVRQWNINQARADESRSLFAPSSSASNGEVVRKILTNSGIGGTRVQPDELILWTGDRIALLNFRNKPAFSHEQLEEAPEIEAEALRLREAELYGQSMRRALERQADEARFMQGLGLGSNPS